MKLSGNWLKKPFFSKILKFSQHQKRFYCKKETHLFPMSVPYPELFWTRHTGLGSQTQSPKLSNVLLSGASFRHRSLSQSHESDVFSNSECKIAKNFRAFAAGPPVSLDAQRFSPCYARRKTSTPKNCWIRHWMYPFSTPESIGKP